MDGRSLPSNLPSKQGTIFHKEPSHTFLLMLDEDGVMILKTCEWLQTESDEETRKILKNNIAMVRHAELAVARFLYKN